MKIPKFNLSCSDRYFENDDLKLDLKKRATQGAGATIFSHALAYGVQVIGTIILARLLTPDNFGLIAMVAAFSFLFQNCGMRGFTEATIQSQVIDHEKISTLFWTHMVLSFALTLIFIALAPFIVWFYGEPRLKLITVAFSFTIIFSALSTQHLALLARNMQFYRISINKISSTVISTVVAIILAWHEWGYWALVAKWVTLSFSSAIAAWILCQWRPGRPARGTEVRPMLKFGMNTYGNFAMNYFSRNLDKILIGWRYGTQLLGNYERAYSFFVMPLNQLSSPLSNVAVAALSRLRDDPEKYRSYYLKALSMLALIGMPLSAILTLIGKDFILLLLGPQWDKAGVIFTVFGPFIGILLVYSTHGWLHLSLGKADRWFRWGIIEMTTSVLAFMIGLPFGAVGVAIAYGLSFYVLLCPGLLYAGKPINIRLFSLLSALWKYYVCALAAGLFCWFLLYSYESTSVIFLGLNTFAKILVSLTLCMSLYLLLIFSFFQGIQPILQLISILRDMKPSYSNA